jgi:hypothetical protein
MRTYHPIHRLERSRLPNVFTDKRFWVGVAIVGFIALFTLLIVTNLKTGGM